MTDENQQACIVCGVAGAQLRGVDPRCFDITVSCPRCGEFIFNQGLFQDLDLWRSRGDLASIAAVSSYTRRAKVLRGKGGTDEPPWLVADKVTDLPPSAARIGDVLSEFPRTIGERLDRTLFNLRDLSTFPGASVRITPDDYPLAYAENSTALARIIHERMREINGWVYKALNELLQGQTSGWIALHLN